MAFQSMISDHREMSSRTVIEAARRAAGLSQRRLAGLARTQQSSISEYERRRKSPTLDVVERLLDAADHELTAKQMVFWDLVEDPEGGSFWVPDKLWAVPVPRCFAKVQAFKYVFPAEVWVPGGGVALMAMLRTWDEDSDQRRAIDEQIRAHLRGLREADVPPLVPSDGQD